MAPDGNRAHARAPVRAVLLDALGTLVGLEAPAPHLVRELADRGVRVGPREAGAAMHAEMSLYRAEHRRGQDAAGLDALRDDCAGALGAALGPAAAGLTQAELKEVLLASLRFFAYPEVAPVLRELRGLGLRLVICSNWDVSLHEVLAATGLDGLIDGVVVSAVEGVAKPDPELMARALQAAGGVPAGQAIHVGDSVSADVMGALAAGVRPVLLARAGDEVRSADTGAAAPQGVPVLADLRGLIDLLSSTLDPR